MKRRSFVRALGASSVLSLMGPAWGSDRHRDAVRPLTAVFERLPAVLSGAVATPVSSLGGPLDADWDLNLYPLLIGLGPRAERLLEHLAGSAALPADAGLYHPARAPVRDADGWLERRLQKTAIAMLLVDPEDPAARRDAWAWARRLAQAEVYLPVALVFDRRGPIPKHAWHQGLPLPVIEIQVSEPALGPWSVIQAMLPGLPFHQPTLVGVDLVDTRSALQAGPRAVATAVRWSASFDRAAAIERACTRLPPSHPAGILGWITTSPDYSIDEFDDTLQLLEQRFGPSAAVVCAPFIDTGFAPGERLLSLTMIGA